MRNKVSTRNNIFFAALFFVLFLFSASALPHIAARFPLFSLGGRVGGIRLIAPDLLFCASVATGMLYHRNAAAVLGLVFGFMCDSFINPPYLLCTLLYFLAGFFAPRISLAFTKKTPLTMLLAAAPLLLMRSFVSCFNHIASSSSVSLLSLFVGTLLPEYLLNLFASVLMFLFINALFKLFCGRLKRR